MSQPEANEERVGILNLIFGDEGKSRAAFKGGAASNVRIQSSAASATANFVNAFEAARHWGGTPTAMGSPIIMARDSVVGPAPSAVDTFAMTPSEHRRIVEQMERDHAQTGLRALKSQSDAPKSVETLVNEKAHNPSMTDVTRAELDAKFELLDTKLGARIQQAVDAMQARDEVHKHALEKMQVEFTSRDALYAEMAKRHDLSTEKLKSEMAGRDAVYAEIAKRQELAAEKFREEMAGRDAVAAERARAHELTVQKALAEAAGREALMDQRLKSMDGELVKIGDSFKSVKANIWFGVATTASIVAAIVAVALAGFDSGRETSKAIAESTVKLEQLIKAQEAKAAAPATPGAATPAPAATPEAPAAK